MRKFYKDVTNRNKGYQQMQLNIEDKYGNLLIDGRWKCYFAVGCRKGAGRKKMLKRTGAG